MHRNIFFFTKLLLIFLIFMSKLFALELTIIPIKKPILSKIIENQKLSQSILKPKSKPKPENKIKVKEKLIEITKKKKKKSIF